MIMDIGEETLQIMRNAAKRIEERSRAYRLSEESVTNGVYPRVTAHIFGQLDHEGLAILLPVNYSKQYNGAAEVLYRHCMDALGYVGDVEVVNSQGLVEMRVRSANIHNVHNLDRRLLHYPRSLEDIRVVPALGMNYLASSAVARPKRDVKRMHTKAEKLLSYGIGHDGFTTRQAAEFLGLRLPSARQHIRVLLKKKLVEREGKKYVPLVDEMPPAETNRDRLIEYARQKREFGLSNAAKRLKISDSLASHHLKKLVEIGVLRKIKPGRYKYSARHDI